MYPGSVPGAGGRPARRADGPSASTWYGLAVVGGVVFGFGIWTPAWRGVQGAEFLQVGCAAAGGVLFMVGAIYGTRRRASTRPPSIEELPGVEVYRPTGSTEPPRAENERSVSSEESR